MLVDRPIEKSEMLDTSFSADGSNHCCGFDIKIISINFKLLTFESPSSILNRSLCEHNFIAAQYIVPVIYVEFNLLVKLMSENQIFTSLFISEDFCHFDFSKFNTCNLVKFSNHIYAQFHSFISQWKLNTSLSKTHSYLIFKSLLGCNPLSHSQIVIINMHSFILKSPIQIFQEKVRLFGGSSISNFVSVTNLRYVLPWLLDYFSDLIERKYSFCEFIRILITKPQ